MMADDKNYRCKVEGEYPWPCTQFPDRTLLIFTDDLLTRSSDGRGWTKHTGLCCTHILIPEDLVEVWEDAPDLELM